MSFTRALERNSDRNMQQDYRKSRTPRGDDEFSDSEFKKHQVRPAAYIDEDEIEDAEICEKKDRPPRFSTVFAGPAPVSRVVEQDSPPHRRRSGGVLIPLPLFIALAILFFLETTFLFTYTIIGLYNNRPVGLLPLSSTTLQPNSCNCEDRQAGINIAPNFIMTQQGPAATTTLTHILTTTARLDPTPVNVPSTTLSTVISTTTIAAGQSAASMVNKPSPSTASTTQGLGPASAAQAAISHLSSLIHSPIRKPTTTNAKTTPTPALAKKTTSTETTSLAKSSDPYDVTGCFAGQGSVQCQTSKDAIPAGEIDA